MRRELEIAAKSLGGTLDVDNDGYYILISTDDNTPKQNYDDLLDIASSLRPTLNYHTISEI